MKISHSKLHLLLFTILTIPGCSYLHTFQPAAPVERSQNPAVIRIETKSMNSEITGNIISEPDNEIFIKSVDGNQAKSRENVHVPPGKHTIEVACAFSKKVFGTKTFVIDAIEGKEYIITYPDGVNMHAFTVDFTACQKLIIK